MKKMLPTRWIHLAYVAALFITAADAAPSPYAGIVVLGTSLSDPGNAFAVRGEINTPPDFFGDALLIPSAPYARGGLHVSNGAPWIVQFARPLGLAGSVQAAFRDSNRHATNYAIDRARARDDGINVNLSDQLSQFVQDVGGTLPPDRLYVVEIGSNDVRDALAMFLLGGNGGPILEAALTSIGAALTELYQRGARQFLIANVPDISLTPAARTLNALYSPQTNTVLQLASSLVQGFNAGLDGIVAQLVLAGADVARLDLYGGLYDIMANPTAFGLTNIISPCITPNEPPFTCQNPDEYLFWDGAHPTEAVHAIFAEEAAITLGL
jgi:phospholipase/lecithinase/hemolysin